VAAVAAAAALVCLIPRDSRGWQGADLPAVRLEGGAGQTPRPPAMAVARLDDRGLDLDADRSISVTFAEPLPVRDVLMMLFRGTPMSVVFDPGVNGTFSGELSNLTLRQALEAVLAPGNLDYRIDETVIHVSPLRAETRFFEVSHVNVRRSWQRTARSSLRDASGSPADLSSAVESDFFGELEQGVRALLSPSGRFHIDRKAGLVQVTDLADRVEQVGIYVETATLRATRQVRLQARLVEVALTGGQSIDWASAIGRPGTAGVQAGDFDTVIRAIGAHGAVRVLAASETLATNNEPALIRLVLQQAAPAAREHPGTAAGGFSGGIALVIVPQIGSDGIVHMSVSPAVDQHPLPARDRDGAASRSILEADTAMRVASGETAIISGFLRDSASAASPNDARRAMLFLLTPTVINAGAGPVAGTR
jgi:type II secretory pathway component HofQ